jgi:hypothetical protein
MWGSDACAAAGGLADRTGRPWGGVDGPGASAPRLDVRAIPGRAGWAAGQGLAAPRSPLLERVGTARGHRRWGPAGPGSRFITATSGAAWRQPSCSPRRRRPAVNIMAAPVPRQCRPASSPWPATAGPAPPPAARCRLQVLQVAVAGERPAMDAARPAAPVAGLCGLHGRTSSGLGQQVHLRPLSIPDPGGMLISPGRRVFRQPTRRHRLGLMPGSDQPASRRERQAGAAWRAHLLRGSGPAGQALGQTTPPTPGGLCSIVSVGGCGSQPG